MIDLSLTPWRRLNLSVRHDVWCLVDADDYDWLIVHNWNYGWHAKTPWKYYAKRNIGPARSTVYLHREILTRLDPTPAPDHHGDHRNGNSLDNRRANLRWLLPAENRKHRIARAKVPTLEAIVARLVAGFEYDDIARVA